MTCLEGARWSTGQSKVKWPEPSCWRHVRRRRKDSPHTARWVGTCTSSWPCMNVDFFAPKTRMSVSVLRSWAWARSPAPCQYSRLKMDSSSLLCLRRSTHWLLTLTDPPRLKSSPGKCEVTAHWSTPPRPPSPPDVDSHSRCMTYLQANPEACGNGGRTVVDPWKRCWGRCQVSGRQTRSCWHHSRKGHEAVQWVSISECLAPPPTRLTQTRWHFTCRCWLQMIPQNLFWKSKLDFI